MGAIAESIKEAEAKQAATLSDALNYLEGQAKAPTGDRSIKALEEAGLPTAADESKRRFWKWTAGVGGGALALGALLRMMRAGAERSRHEELLKEVDEAAGSPSTEITIPVPGRKKKAALEKDASAWPYLLGGAALLPTATHGVGESLGSAWRKSKETVGKGYEHLFEPTGSAWTNPWTWPALMAAGALGLYGGYEMTDAVISKLRKRRRKRELAQAQKAFEQALGAQFSEKPASILGAAVDGVAEAYATGELEKQAATVPPVIGEEGGGWWDKLRGAGGYATGGYLALLTLLAALGGAGGYHWVKKRETPRRKYEAAKEILLRRQLAAPPTVTVDTDE